MRKIILLAIAILLASAPSYGRDVSLAEAEEAVRSGKAVPLDVRTPSEFEDGHLPDAVNADVMSPSFLGDVGRLVGKGKTVVVYCRTGRRSAVAAKALEDAGYEIIHMKDGYLAWKKRNGSSSR